MLCHQMDRLTFSHSAVDEGEHMQGKVVFLHRFTSKYITVAGNRNLKTHSTSSEVLLLMRVICGIWRKSFLMKKKR